MTYVGALALVRDVWLERWAGTAKKDEGRRINRKKRKARSRTDLFTNEWHRMAQGGSLFGRSSGPSPRPRGDPERGFFGMGQTEVTRAAITHLQSFVSVDSAWLQTTSGPRSRVLDRTSDRGAHGSLGPSPREEVLRSSHNPFSGGHEVHHPYPEHFVPVYHYSVCFQNRNADVPDKVRRTYDAYCKI